MRRYFKSNPHYMLGKIKKDIRGQVLQLNELIKLENGIDYVPLYIQKFKIDFNGALICASRNGHLEVIKYLIENVKDEITNYNGALNWASKYGQLEVVKYLVKKGGSKVNHNQILFGHQQVKLSTL